MISKDLIDRVVDQGVVDTRKYRYIARPSGDCSGQYYDIVRLQLSDLDRSIACDDSNWELVATSILGGGYIV